MCCEERDSAQLERDLLSNRFKHLESELESEKSAHTERTREARGLEVSLSYLEPNQSRATCNECDRSALV